MHTLLRPPLTTIDQKILQFEINNPTDIGADRKKFIKIGIIYSGFLYREVICESAFEYQKFKENLAKYCLFHELFPTAVQLDQGFSYCLELIID